MAVSRAGGKLEAAFERFGLASTVADARAIDVGASTGGFTQGLLAHGARSVLAVDVGHGQLHASLRADPRVTSLEGVDWKRLSLSVAEGPFDFFTVDVSFVAARNMLRGLAFRLRPGAEGVVLVKPQFELPDRRVKAAGADTARLREEAVDKVRERARGLGFEIVDHFDSPVAGGSGTVEVLAHLRFDGRPDTMPRPGERKRTAPAPRAAAPAEAPATLRWFAVVAPGLEDVVRAELEALPDVAKIAAETGGVAWTGPPASGYRANLWSRVATRVLARVGDVEAREFGKLRHRAARLPWRMFVPGGASVAARASASHCRLYHTGALAEAAVLAVADAVPGVRAAKRDEDADVTLLLRGVDDRFTFSADASGERLHRRGARIETGAAPLRETLAAGLLALAGWQPGTALVDPMCGAGTIVIEAAMQTLGRAPGAGRAFAMERWPLATHTTIAPALAALRDGARADTDPHANAPVAPAPAMIIGSDRDPRMIESASRNAERAGVAAVLTLACRDADGARPPAPTGLVITNPPYGHRLGDVRAATRGYRDLGRMLRAHFRGWRAAIVTPARLEAERQLGMRTSARFPLRNGGLAIVLHVFDVA
jgi:23S rRNA G2445 N2-methylase RlmL/predicted rRNA methylase YqxC with S4 and FtsJ domains